LGLGLFKAGVDGATSFAQQTVQTTITNQQNQFAAAFN
jgi:hypothetical protein